MIIFIVINPTVNSMTQGPFKNDWAIAQGYVCVLRTREEKRKRATHRLSGHLTEIAEYVYLLRLRECRLYAMTYNYEM